MGTSDSNYVVVQEKLWLRYDYVPNERRIAASNRAEITIMKRQSAQWDAPLSQSFLWLFDDRGIDDITASRKRKRYAAAQGYLRASKVEALSDTDASISSHDAHHPPRPPSLTNSEHDLPATNTSHFACPPFQRSVSRTTRSNITQQSLRSQNSVCLE